MTDPLSPAMMIHLASATPALAIGAIQLSRTRRDGAHRTLGWIWAALMLTAAVSSFWILDIFDGWPSPIHILSLVIIHSVISAIRAIKAGHVERHRRWMTNAYIGLAVAGAFTLLPNRFLGQALLGAFGG